MNIFKIKMGDPSGDGHSQTETTVIRCNKTKEQVLEAYSKSCDLTGLVFTENKDVTINGKKIDWQHPEYMDRKVCVDYESYEISDLAQNILKSFGIENPTVDGDIDVLFDIFMDFIKISLPDIEYDVIPDLTDTLDLTIGYGLFA